MMKYLILSLFFCFNSFAHLDLDFKVLESDKTTVKLVSQAFKKSDLKCIKDNNCFIFLGKISDSYLLENNGNKIINKLGVYLSHQISYDAIPENSLRNNNQITITIKSLKGYLDKYQFKKAYIGDYDEVLTNVILDWIPQTGITLISMSFIIFLLILLISISFIAVDKRLIFLSLYCFVTFIYLFSFSEYPRTIFDPEVMSGGVHFSLRLIQDLFLFILFRHFLSHDLSKKQKYFFKTTTIIYSIIILLMLLPLLFGLHHFSYHLSVIQWAGLLVAFPMGYGFYLALKTQSNFERKILVPTTFILFLFQLNDLMNFWGIINTYYTVKFYIPFLIILLIFIYLSRRIQEGQNIEIYKEKYKIAMQVAHDIKSPVAALETCVENLEIKDSNMNEIFNLSFERIKSVANSILPGHSARQKINLEVLLKEVISLKRTELKDIKINLETEGIEILGRKSELERIISNIINNSYESNEKDCILHIKLFSESSNYILEFTDNGPGFPKEILDNFGTRGLTVGKKNGSGLGLAYLKEVVTEMNSLVEIFNKQGANIKITFPKSVVG